MNTRITALIALALSTAAVGCAATPAPVALVSASDTVETTPAPGAGGEMCTVVRRGASGGVRDARIAEHWPARNYGAASSSYAGNVAGGARQTLLAFDLPEVPKGAVITSAKIRLHKCVCGGSGVTAHSITKSWDERTVTWDNFGAAYAEDAVSLVPAGDPERTSFDVTELARGWADGTTQNHGILLTQDNANTAFSTSEVADPAERPLLEICWSQHD